MEKKIAIIFFYSQKSEMLSFVESICDYFSKQHFKTIILSLRKYYNTTQWKITHTHTHTRQKAKCAFFFDFPIPNYTQDKIFSNTTESQNNGTQLFCFSLHSVWSYRNCIPWPRYNIPHEQLFRKVRICFKQQGKVFNGPLVPVHV